MAILSIVTAPDGRLTQRSSSVAAVTYEVRSLLDDMLETMYHDKGVGLAAVQVGVLQQMLVIDLQSNDHIQKDPGFYPIFMVNPEIIYQSEELITAEEGCLSLPEQRVEITRAESVKVKFLDYNNNQQVLEANDWLARVIQHEIDHLNGRLMIDYLSYLKKNVAMRRLCKLKNDIV